MSGKNIQNELGTVNHPGIDFLFYIALLGGRKLMVDEHKVGVHRSYRARNFLELAFADQRCRIRTVAMLHEFTGNFRAGRCHKLTELGQRFFNPNTGDTAPLCSVRRDVAREHGTGRQLQVTVGTGTITELQSYEKRTLRTVTTSLDPGRRLKSAGTLPRNKLALRLAGGAFALCRRGVLAALEVAAFCHNDG